MSRVLLFHKPKGVVVSRSDELGRKTVYDALPDWVQTEGWVPVGRLDRDTRGLLLFVQDRSLVDPLTSPGSVPKTYEVWLRGRLTPSHIREIRRGVDSPVGILRCQNVTPLGTAGPKQRVQVVLDEGKNRHIRRMFGTLKDEVHGTPLKVLDLKRIQFGPVSLDVPSGAWRFLTDAEVEELLHPHRTRKKA
ncbi:MAG TPA: pseudouridine synthase [Acidobacteriota bacterium]|nr:pseudouridine synthase [Acidobacteriota bacterium]